ncbi:fungal-specific transcription factor domain-domain-containing protein [Clohesyomyces aquaticus]|uniref:Fungal-specific transcription factor domain-domain-containing protein n=1 Tax=Clohesyomyces aquaticus TaxID=1231657 RepID=A0A1Y2A4F1_9PLEO|nr:fungal-specific transcription factor domain-domain-containing protein [Clohesyomyces aquaticus]
MRSAASAMDLLGDVSFLDALETTDIFSVDLPAVEIPTTSANHGPRPYRSRKNRPCDFCRARKAACKISVAPPCVLCHSYGKECTFNNESKRKRSVAQPVDDGSPLTQKARVEEEGNEDSINQTISPQSLNSALSWSPPTNGHVRNHSSNTESDWGLTNYSQAPILRSPTLRQPVLKQSSKGKRISFALSPTKSSVWVGETGEADPWLCRRYQYDKNDECVLSRIAYQRIRPEPNAPRRNSINDGYQEPPLVFMRPDDALADKGEPRVDLPAIEDARKEVIDLVPDEIGVRMLKLFFRFVYPYFPVLSREQMLTGDIQFVVQSLPLSLLSAIYATTLPFMLYDDYLATAVVHSAPSARRLYQICWMAVNQEMHAPRLATLQACLLLLQRPPTNRYIMDTPWRWSCTAWTVSLASIMGLCKSCSGWSDLAPWERRLRGRLWWATYILDKWSLLGAGMPSHIDDDNFDVPEPTLDPNPAADYSLSPSSSLTGDDLHDLLAVPTHFYHLVHLTTILSDIVKAFYSIRASSQTAKNFTLSLERAKPLRTRLKEWKEVSNEAIASTKSADTVRNDSHSPEDTANPILKEESGETLDGNASLRLAYIIAVMTLYRALLRAIENTAESATNDEGPSVHTAGRAAVLAGARECSKEAVEFAEDLRSRGAIGVWDAFWHSWSRSNFALATSFLMRVLVNISINSSPTKDDDIHEVRALIARWRRVLRLMSGNSGNGMTSLALLRLEGDLLQEPGLLRQPQSQSH